MRRPTCDGTTPFAAACARGHVATVACLAVEVLALTPGDFPVDATAYSPDIIRVLMSALAGKMVGERSRGIVVDGSGQRLFGVLSRAALELYAGMRLVKRVLLSRVEAVTRDSASILVRCIGGETVAAAVALRDAAPGGATFVTEALSLQLATLAHTAARETSSPAQAPSRPPAQSKSGARGKPGRRSDRGSPSLKGGSRSRASLAPMPSKSQVGFTGPEREELAAAELAVDLAAASVPGVGPVFSLAAAKARVHDDARTSAIAASPHLWREAWTLLRARHTPRDSDVNLTETLKAATVAVESDLAAARARLADLRTRIAEREQALTDLGAVLSTTQRQAADASRELASERRRADRLDEDLRVATRALDAASEQTTDAIVRVAELEQEVDVLRAELDSVTAAWHAAEGQRKHA